MCITAFDKHVKTFLYLTFYFLNQIQEVNIKIQYYAVGLGGGISIGLLRSITLPKCVIMG